MLALYDIIKIFSNDECMDIALNHLKKLNKLKSNLNIMIWVEFLVFLFVLLRLTKENNPRPKPRPPKP
jgi:hypothetical protein